MVYIWEDKHTGIIVEVERPIRNYEEPPDSEESVESGLMTKEQWLASEWMRLMRHPNDTKSHRTYIRPEGKGFDTPGSWSR